MPSTTQPPDPPTPGLAPLTADARLLADLRADLVEGGFTVDGIAEVLGPLAARALHREQPLPADLATRENSSAAAVLTRLFSLGVAVPSARLAPVVARTGITGLLELGLVRELESDTGAADAVVATCDLRPYGDEEHQWWVASDQSELATGEPLPADHVLGIGGASTTLASWTPRPPVGRALDLGTGSGVQALHLTTHCAEVVATDISERALSFARFNAALNEVTLDLRPSDMFAAVAGEGFDLVVSNPPFVITPRLPGETRYEYRDAGLVGDAAVAGLVRAVSDHLAPDGMAQFLGNWEMSEAPDGRPEDWREVVSSWLEGTGLDAWVVQREVQDPAEYAETWARDAGHVPGSPAHGQMYAAWLADFAARGVRSIGFGIITLHRPATDRAPWRDLVEVTGPVAAPMGPTVLDGIRARTWLAEHGDEAVLSTAWRCAPDVTEERHGRPGAPDPHVILIRQGGGLRRVFRADTVLAAFVGVCDGQLTARQALDAIATLVDADASSVRSQSLPRIRELIADGLLVS
ncbi:MAG TPA: class I SAM-dependent methyltransferase [Segeticoccus sp.]|uniref:class I SAM-dependent methyltransferase n=1 Tax=Segeticoccus sp. TaxID=2706531 RepID=UPI002D7FE427|nr:class I SAM-dependent methyltransferase [Segeticoccus sp.]HET8600395.1 class I SAM-dependent methyltransferase [Segeticoccus sp.]